MATAPWMSGHQYGYQYRQVGETRGLPLSQNRPVVLKATAPWIPFTSLKAQISVTSNLPWLCCLVVFFLRTVYWFLWSRSFFLYRKLIWFVSAIHSEDPVTFCLFSLWMAQCNINYIL